MSSFDAGRIVATADLDRDPFQRGLDEARAEGRRFAGEKYAPKIGADTADADAKLYDLRAKLARLNDERVNPKVDLEGVTSAEVRIAGLQAQLDRLNRTGGAGRGGGPGGIGSFFDKHRGPGLLGSAVGLGLPTLGPLAGVGLGVGASFLTPTVAGGLGLGAFAAGARSSIQAVAKDTQKLTVIQGQYNAAVTNKQRAAALLKEHQLWKTLDPAQRQAVKNVQGLDSAWKGYQKALQPQTFSILSQFAGIAKTGLHDILPVAKDVGNVLDATAAQVKAALEQPFWHHFFHDFLQGEAPIAVKTLTTVLDNVVTGFAHLAEDFAPLGHDLETASVQLSTKFEQWTQGRGPGKFVAFVQKEGPIVARDLGGIAKALIGIGKGLSPIGQVELKALGPVLDFVGKLSDEHPAVITAVGTALLGVGAGLKVIAGARAAAGVLGALRGARIGGDSGGILGSVTSKASPVPVYVTNWTGGGVGGRGGPGGVAGAGGAAAGTAEKEAEAVGASAGVKLLGAVKAGALKGLRRGLVGVAVTAAGDVVGNQLTAHGHRTAGYAAKNTADVYGSLAVFGPEVAGPIAALTALFSALPRTGLGSQLTGANRQAFLHTVATTPAQIANTQAYLTKNPAVLSQYRQQLPNLSPQQLIEYISGLRKVDAAQKTASGSAKTLGAGVAQFDAQLAKNPALARAFTSAEVKMGGAVQTLAAQILAASGSVYNKALSLGENLMQGVIDGMNLKGPAAKATAAHIAGVILKAHSQALGNASPSKFTRRDGKWLMDGLILGWLGELPHAQRAMAAGTSSLLHQIEAQAAHDIVKTQHQLADARAQLTGDRQAKGSYISGLRSTYTGYAGIGGAVNANGSVGNVAGFLRSRLVKLRQFVDDLRKLTRRGLAPGLIQQIADLGPDGGLGLAQSILSGASGSIGTLNRLQNQVDSYARQGATYAGNAVYDPKIAADKHRVARLEHKLDHLRSDLHELITLAKHNPQATGAAIEAAFRGAHAHSGAA